MNYKSGFFLTITFFLASLPGHAFQAGIGSTSKAVPAPPANVPVQAPPAHPASEETLRRYFEVFHFVSHNRKSLEIQLDQQKKTLPAWYPADIWDETTAKILQLDAVAIAIPVYQQYYSEEGTQNAILLFLTPNGQAMIRKVYGETLDKETSGDDADVARRKALADERAKEDQDVRSMLKSMTPEQERQVTAFVQSAEWKRINGLSNTVYNAFNVAYLAKQEEIVHSVAQSHVDELRKALREYKTTHPGVDPVTGAATPAPK